MNSYWENSQEIPPWDEFDSEAILSAAQIVVEAAQSLAWELPDSRQDLEYLATLLTDAIRRKPPRFKRIFQIGPHAKAIDRPPVSVVEMILRRPDPDPVRTAKLLLRAIAWSHWPRPSDAESNSSQGGRSISKQ